MRFGETRPRQLRVRSSCVPASAAADLTGSLDSGSSANVPDPSPRVDGAGGAAPPSGGYYRYKVFEDEGAMSVRLIAKSPDDPALVFQSANGPSKVYPTASPQVLWTSSSNGRAGFAATQDSAAWRLMFFPPGAPVGAPVIVDDADSPFGCISDDGSTYAYSRGGSIWLKVPGVAAPRRISGYSPGACAAVRGAILLAGYKATANGDQSSTAYLNARIETDLGTDPEEVRLAASPLGTLTYVANHTATTLTSAGVEESERHNVDDVRYDDLGDMVAVNSSGGVEWVPADAGH